VGFIRIDHYRFLLIPAVHIARLSAFQSVIKLHDLKRLMESNNWPKDAFIENSVKPDKVISEKKKKQNPIQAKGKLFN
jgi:hypothetical protein